jgi:hypothetical protein
MSVCGSSTWQALGVWSSRYHRGLRGGSLGESGCGGAEEWAQGSEIPWPGVALWAYGRGLGVQRQLFF